MPVKTTIPYTFGTFFITFTNYKWLPLIEEVNGYDLVYKWFDKLTTLGHYLHGFVIMPNHIHCLISFSETDSSINTIIGNGKRFLAYDIVDRLKLLNKTDLLSILSAGVKPNRKDKNQLHTIWEPSFDWKYCYDIDFIMQKLNYMHLNPFSGKWNLCENPIDYIHSSARFYLTGEQSFFPLTYFFSVSPIGDAEVH